MKYAILTVLMQLCLLVPCSLRADIIIDAGNPTLQANTANQRIAISVTSNEAVQGLNFNFQVEALGLQAVPFITAIDIIGPGTVFAANNTGVAGEFFGDNGDGLGSQIAIASTTTAAGTIVPNGVIGFITFDTTGLGAGTYNINLANTVNGAFDFAGVPVTSFQNTSLTIAAIPEPSTIAVLSAAGAAALYRRRKVGSSELT